MDSTLLEQPAAKRDAIPPLENGIIEWFALESDEYRPLPEVDGAISSRVFPGLTLNATAALSGDHAAVLETLRGALAADPG